MTPDSPQALRHEQVVKDKVGDQVDHYSGQAARQIAESDPQRLQQALTQTLVHLQSPPRVPHLTEDQFRHVAQYVFNEKIACRYGRGTDTRGAAYSLTDITKKGKQNLSAADAFRWLQSPYSDEYDSWDHRLWNTCMVIVGLARDQPDKKVVLLGGVPSGTGGERYNNQFGEPQGDGKTFGKVNITEMAATKAEITIDSVDNLLDQGTKLYCDIYSNLRELANAR
jgi:hypothetical protein